MRTYGLLVLIVIAGVVGVALYTAQQPRISYSDTDPSYNRAYWEEQITHRGAPQAYRAFVEKNAIAPRNRQHFSAHAMGAAVYAQLGLPGIAVCDQRFAFGCYHGFTSRAIAEGGEQAITTLNTTCRDTFGIEAFNLVSMCQHGLGHGILEYVGYQHLTQALSMCASLVDQPAPRVGCTSGVFMEYFTPLAQVNGGMEPALRPFDTDNPFDPCPSVPEAFQQSCYFELGQALRQTEGSQYLSVCAQLSGVPRTNCFLGVGTDMARIPDPADVVARCEVAAPEDALFCRAGAAWGYSGDGSERSKTVCAYDELMMETRCRTVADLTEGLEPPFTSTTL